MAQVTIGGTEYTAYSTVDNADSYMQASINAATWNENSAEDKAVYLVEATRVFDRQAWREGYQTFAEREAVDAIVNASIELASLFAQGETDTLSNRTTRDHTKSLKAGSVTIEYFKSFETTSRFPLIVHELVKDYLAGTSSSYRGAASWGTSGTSLEQDYDFDEGI